MAHHTNAPLMRLPRPVLGRKITGYRCRSAL